MPSLSELIKNEASADILAKGQNEAKACMDKGQTGRVFNGFPPLTDEKSYADFSTRFFKIAEKLAAKQKELMEKGKWNLDPDPDKLDENLKSELEPAKLLIENQILEYVFQELINPFTGEIKDKIMDNIFSNLTEIEKKSLSLHLAEVANSLLETIYDKLPVSFTQHCLEKEYGRDYCDQVNAAIKKYQSAELKLRGPAIEVAIAKECGEEKYKKYIDLRDKSGHSVEPMIRIKPLLGLGREQRIEDYLDTKIQNFCKKNQILEAKLDSLISDKIGKINTKIGKYTRKKNKPKLDAQTGKQSNMIAISQTIESYKKNEISVQELHRLLSTQRDSVKSVKKTGNISRLFESVNRISPIKIDKPSGATNTVTEALKEIEKVYPEVKIKAVAPAPAEKSEEESEPSHPGEHRGHG